MDEFDKYTFIYTNYTLKITKYTNLRRQINRKRHHVHGLEDNTVSVNFFSSWSIVSMQPKSKSPEDLISNWQMILKCIWKFKRARITGTTLKGKNKIGKFILHYLISIGEGNGNPLQRSCLENPRDGGAWWAAVYGVAQSRTQLKQLSSSSSTWFQYLL